VGALTLYLKPILGEGGGGVSECGVCFGELEVSAREAKCSARALLSCKALNRSGEVALKERYPSVALLPAIKRGGVEREALEEAFRVTKRGALL
jgi:hypothetical protein